MATIARAIRRLLVDHSRQKSAAKRGPNGGGPSFDEFLLQAPIDHSNWEDLSTRLWKRRAV